MKGMIKIMKKASALVLAILMICSALLFAGCGKSPDDKGAVVKMYISAFPSNLDPTAVNYGSADNAKLFGLLYEGLFRINSKGKLEKGVADEYKYFADARDNTLKLEIKLKATNWSDGIAVDAEDFVYAWQRLLNSETDNTAAALLYPIKNARKVKEGQCSINDLGVCAIKDNVLQITFEKDFTNVEYFIRRLASPVLVPLREENASKFDDKDNSDYSWQTSSAKAIPLTNGPFKYKNVNDKEIVLERSLHYNNVSELKDNPVDKAVKPYQLITVYSDGATADEQIDKFLNGEIFYINLSEADEETIKKAGKTQSTLIPSTYTYFFDTTSRLFGDARVRQALSIALDREHINSLTGRGTKAAEGIIPFGVEDTMKNTEFRKAAGNMFAPKGDIEKAKELLAEANVKSGSFTIEYNKDREYEEKIAEYAKSVWKELGFSVTLSGKNSKYFYGITSENTKFAEGDAKIIGLDFQCTTPDAYSVLVGFSKKYAGGRADAEADEPVYTKLNITGYDSEEYDIICDAIVYAANNEKRAEAMHTAEEKLIEDSPVIPLFNNADVYASKELSKIDADFFGAKNFTKMKMKNYQKHLPAANEG